MAQTVIGIFDTYDQAELAVQNLISSNFSKEYIDISKAQEVEGRGDMTDEHNTLGSKAGVYFSKIFSNTDDVLKYASVAQRGVIVAVQTEWIEDAERAAAILDAYGAINVEERARVLEDSWTRQDRQINAKDARERPDSAYKEPTVKTTESPTPGILIRSRIVDRPIGNDLRVREETVRIEKISNVNATSPDDETGTIKKG
jgi:hypothetical protein